MPTYMICARDRAGAGTLRADTRPDHLRHLDAVAGRLVMAGPWLDADGAPAGSLILCDFPDLDEARAFAAADPYARAGLFAEVTVAAWRRVLP